MGVQANRRKERVQLFCHGSYASKCLASDYLEKNLPCLTVAFCFRTGPVSIKIETIIKVKMANVDFLILQISQLRQKRS